MHEALVAEAIDDTRGTQVSTRWVCTERRLDAFLRWAWAAGSQRPAVSAQAVQFATDLCHLRAKTAADGVDGVDGQASTAGPGAGAGNAGAGNAGAKAGPIARSGWASPHVLLGALPRSVTEWTAVLRAGVSAVVDVSITGPLGACGEGYLEMLQQADVAAGCEGRRTTLELLHFPQVRVPGTADMIDEVANLEDGPRIPPVPVSECRDAIQQLLAEGATVRHCCGCAHPPSAAAAAAPALPISHDAGVLAGHCVTPRCSSRALQGMLAPVRRIAHEWMHVVLCILVACSA